MSVVVRDVIQVGSHEFTITGVFVMPRCCLMADARIATMQLQFHVTKCLSLVGGVAVTGLQFFDHCQPCN